MWRRLSLCLGLVASEKMTLHMLADGEGGNACLDGSPFGFYVQRNAASSNWVIDIAGGGWCDSIDSCVTRNTRLASSTTWDANRNGVGISSDQPSENPSYHTYNHVYFPYCDGSSFSSHRDSPLPSHKSARPYLHMRGHDNLHAALASLKKDHGMSGVDELIVTGGSAGGLSVILHVDEIASIVAATRVVGIPDGGAFRVIEDGCCAWQDIVTLHNSVGGLPHACTSAQASGKEWQCFTVPVLHSFVQRPLFVLQSQFDHFQLDSMDHNRCSKAQAYHPPWKSITCSQSDLDAIAAYGAGWFDDFSDLLASPKVGAFVTGCLAHEERAKWTGLVAGGSSLHDAFVEWHDGGSRTRWIENCTLPCNPNPTLCAPIGLPTPSPTPTPTPTPPSPSPTPGAADTLEAKRWLEAGSHLLSQNGEVSLQMQASDGNLVLYQRQSTGHRALWSSGTSGHAGSRLAMQPDGNLVLYTSKSSGHHVLWASGTTAGATKAVVRDECDLVLTDDAGRVLWTLLGNGCGGSGETLV